MKKIILSILFVSAIGFSTQPAAATMMNVPNSNVPADDHTAKEEAEGKEIWTKLQDKDLTCDDLGTDDYERLGEYFMGLMMGDSHAAMNQMMIQTMGEDGEEAMHEVMGRRMTECDSTAVLPVSATGYMPMMQMMSGGYSSYNYNDGVYGNSMMGSFGLFGLMGWGLMVLFWVLTILAIVALVKWLMNQSGSSKNKK